MKKTDEKEKRGGRQAGHTFLNIISILVDEFHHWFLLSPFRVRIFEIFICLFNFKKDKCVIYTWTYVLLINTTGKAVTDNSKYINGIELHVLVS